MTSSNQQGVESELRRVTETLGQLIALLAEEMNRQEEHHRKKEQTMQEWDTLQEQRMEELKQSEELQQRQHRQIKRLACPFTIFWVGASLLVFLSSAYVLKALLKGD